MQKLYPVGFTTELDGLILSTRKGAKTGRYVVPLDGKLLRQLADADRRRDGGRHEDHRLGSPRLVRPESSLSPREMQDRIRSGWSVDEVAAEAGVDLDWVRRFASPVFAEVGRIVELAQRCVYDKPRFGLSAQPLGASVRRNITERGVRLLEEDLDEAWSAYQLDEAIWVVRFEYTSRGRSQEAEWVFDPAEEELTSRNRLASQLGWVRRGRPKKAPSSPVVPKPSPETRARAKTVARAVPAPAPKSAKPAKKRAVGKKTLAKKTVAKKTVAEKTATRVAKKVVKKAAPAPRARRAPKKKAAARPAKRPAKKRRPAPLLTAPTAPTPPPPEPVWEPEPVREPEPEPMWEPEPTIEAPVVRGPLSPPAPLPVPEFVREAVATPIGADDEPPLPGAVEVDHEHGIARIDSRRTSHYVSGRPRRTQPLRGR